MSPRYAELAAWLRREWKAEPRDVTANAIFAELELENGAKRSLLESVTFRTLLAEPEALPAAA